MKRPAGRRKTIGRSKCLTSRRIEFGADRQKWDEHMFQVQRESREYPLFGEQETDRGNKMEQTK